MDLRKTMIQVKERQGYNLKQLGTFHIQASWEEVLEYIKPKFIVEKGEKGRKRGKKVKSEEAPTGN